MKEIVAKGVCEGYKDSLEGLLLRRMAQHKDAISQTQGLEKVPETDILDLTPYPCSIIWPNPTKSKYGYVYSHELGGSQEALLVKLPTFSLMGNLALKKLPFKRTACCESSAIVYFHSDCNLHTHKLKALDTGIVADTFFIQQTSENLEELFINNKTAIKELIPGCVVFTTGGHAFVLWEDKLGNFVGWEYERIWRRVNKYVESSSQRTFRYLLFPGNFIKDDYTTVEPLTSTQEKILNNVLANCLLSTTATRL